VAQQKETSEGGDPVILGRVSGLYGVRGWVRVFSYTEPRDALLDYRHWLLRSGAGWSAIAVVGGRRQGKSVVAKLAGIDDRDAADAWVGADIAVTRESLPATGDGQYYWADLEGLEVRHRDGRILGRVAHMLATGANDVMVVQPGKQAEAAGRGAQEILIPFVPEVYILRVDIDEGVIDVDWEWD
jgi:16S rRNA processing protein RimM